MNVYNKAVFEKQLQNFIIQKIKPQPTKILKVPNGYWDSKENQRKYFDGLKKRLGIREPKDWAEITIAQIYEFGGSTILKKHHGNSLIRALQYVYPDLQFNEEWFTKASNRFWHQKENQRNFLKQFANKFNIKEPCDWGKIRLKTVIEEGGSSILGIYDNSLRKTLNSVFPEVQWKNEWFQNIKPRPSRFWKSSENRREFMDKLWKELGIKTPSEWGNITTKDILSHGGNSILHHFKTIPKILKATYPELEWKEEWFSRTHIFEGGWNNIQNQRKFLETLRSQYNIEKPSDWGKLTRKELLQSGASILLKYHDGLIYNALKFVFPEWFPQVQKMNWTLKENQKQFLDSLANKFGIKKPSDWGKIKVNDVIENGGGRLLTLYGGTMFYALKSVYSDITWKRDWFPRISKYPSNYWENTENHRIFLEQLAIDYGLKNFTDWSKVSISLIKQRGGKGLLAKYNYSLFQILQAVYPNSFDILSRAHYKLRNVVTKHLS